MQDQFQRKIEYLRISVTDCCNLRCRYCMPAHGVHRKKHEASGVPVRAIAPNAAAVFTAAHRYYHAANGGEPFEAKG